MEVCGPNGFKCDEEKVLNSLLDAFGSAFSLEEIASAYCKANRDADLAGEILVEKQNSSSTSTTNSFGERYPKPKFHPVSAGTVSSRLGKDYVRSMPSASRNYHKTTKPLKLDANLLTMSEIWDEKCEPNNLYHNQLHQDMEDFLFKMLGDGFQLDREKIREVLDNCGYDMKKSMDKLMNESVLTLDKEARVVGESSTGLIEKKSERVNNRGSITVNGEVDLYSQSNDREKLQRELLTCIFQVREYSEETSKKIVKDVRKPSSYRKVVDEPPEDSSEEFKFDTNFSRRGNIDVPEDEEEFQNLRKAVKEYGAAMIEYHKAAVDAFVNGDYDKAKKLLEQGQEYLTKAHEADEQSSNMIVETNGRNGKSQEMVVNLHEHSSGQAKRLLKCHLSTLYGIPSLEYLKVIIDANNDDVLEDSQRQKRKKRITEMLDKESINWIESETPGTILIRLDKIDPKRRSS